MYKLALLFSFMIALNATAKNDKEPNELDYAVLMSEQQQLENKLFNIGEDRNNAIAEIAAIKITELDEEVELGFDTANYLPKGFNGLKGMHDLDWSNIELVELDEEVALGFDTADYLPEGFNALKGKHDIDWSTIELFELDENVELCIDTANYLPKDFNALKGKHDLDWASIEVVEIEDEIEFEFDIEAYLPVNFDPTIGIENHEAVVCLY